MTDLTPETLAEWHDWVRYHRTGAGNNAWNRAHEPRIELGLNEFEALLDALDAEKAAREEAERAVEVGVKYREALADKYAKAKARVAELEAGQVAAVLADDARWGFIDPHGPKAAKIRAERATND